MPRKCCVPSCISNCRSSLKEDKKIVTTFSFPNDEKRRSEWIRAIPRKNWTPSHIAAVCSKHFTDSEVIRYDKLVKPDGSSTPLLLTRPRLKETAVPSIFPNLQSSDKTSKKKMVMCWVPDCTHYSEQGICRKFYKFPKDKELLNKWLMLVRRSESIPSVNSVICSCHFVDGNRYNLPTIFLDIQKQTERSIQYVNKNDLPTKHVKPVPVTYEGPSHSNLRSVLEPATQKQKIPAPIDTKMYCRMCLNPVTKDELICLGEYHNVNYPSRTVQYKRHKILQTEMHLKMIKMLMPNFNHGLVYNPVMCDACRARLQSSADFVEQCMATQKLIQQFKDENYPSEKMVACEEVVMLSTSNAKGCSSPKKRKTVEEPSSSSTSTETRTVPSAEEFQDPEYMEENDEKFEVTEEELGYIKQEIFEEASQIQTDDVAIKTEPEYSSLTDFVVKNEPCSTITSDFTVMADPISVKRFSTKDKSCNVNSAVNNSSSLVHKVDLSSSATVPVSNCPKLQVVEPDTFITVADPKTFSNVNSQFKTYQNR